MIWSVSWKNIWRNKTRSLVVIIAVTLGIISGVLLIGILKGWVEQRLHDAIYNEVSHLQIHNTEYLKNEELHLTITDSEDLIRKIENIPGLIGWTERTKIVGMANTPWASSGVIVHGIDPEKEKQVSEIYKKILPEAGEYLDTASPWSILISDKTAEILKLKQYIITDEAMASLRDEGLPESIISDISSLKDVRYKSLKEFREVLKSSFNKKTLNSYGRTIIDNALVYRLRNKIQITVSDENGVPAQGAFRVCGIYKTTNGGFDQSTVFVNMNDLATLYSDSSLFIHEIAVLLDDKKNVELAKASLSGISSSVTVNTWKELSPDAAMMNDYMVIYYFIFIGIIMLALAFGIINTMMMTILERTKELGMLMAIGMNRKRVFTMIMLETMFLTSVGAVLGMLSGWLITEVLGKTGIHFSGWGEGFEAIGFAARVYPVVSFDFFVFITLMVIVTAIISSLWPARKALSLNPVEALRTE
jgi:ABC-type lipoprotein release transport system permease subunit